MRPLPRGDGGPPLTRLLPLLFLGAMGLAITLYLLPDVVPGASVDFHQGRGDILERSSRFMRELGHQVEGLQQDAFFQFDERTHLFLQEQYGMSGANRMLRADSLPGHHWDILWYDRRVSQSQGTESFTARMSPGGRLLGFDHTISDTASMASLGNEEARALAESFLARYHPDFAEYRLKTSSDIKHLHRTDHQFLYGKASVGMEMTLTVRVQGDEVGSMEWAFVHPGEFLGRISSLATGRTLGSTVSIAATFLLFFIIVTLFLRKYHEGEVGTRTAAMVFLGFVGVAFALALNQFSGLGAHTGIADLNKFYVRIIVFVLDVFVFQMFLGVLVFAAWSVGESSSRAVWPQKMTAMDSALFRRFFTLDIGASVLRGYGWGLVVLGLHALLTLLLVRQGFWILPGDVSSPAESFVMGIQPVFEGLWAAVFGEVISRLFFLSFLREKLRKPWLGVLIATAIWVLVSYFSWQVPFGLSAMGLHLGLLAAYGLVFAFLFLRYDLLTAITAHTVIMAITIAIPFLTSTGPWAVQATGLFWAVMAVPLLLGVVGCIRRKRFEFSPSTLPTHIQRISERVRMAKELEIARNVQLSLLPREQPVMLGYDIAGVCLPAEEVGGDYFDFVHLGSRKLGIALGDVSGKGVPAAIYMTLTKGILQSHAEEHIRPKQVLCKVNSLMYRTIERNSFVSMLYAILDAETRTLRFARAGQCPVILAQNPGGEGKILTPPGMALGLERGSVFDAVLEEQEIPLRRGEVLVFYTDGFTEAMNGAREEYGEERLVASVARHRHRPAAELIQGICADVHDYAGSMPQHDDMTMVVVKILPEQEH